MKILKQNTETSLRIARSIFHSRVMMLLTKKQTNEERIFELRKYIRKLDEAYQQESNRFPKFKKGFAEYCFCYRFSLELLKEYRQCISDNRTSFEVTYTSLFENAILDPMEYRELLSGMCRKILIFCNFTNFKEFFNSLYPDDFEHINEFIFIIKLC